MVGFKICLDRQVCSEQGIGTARRRKQSCSEMRSLFFSQTKSCLVLAKQYCDNCKLHVLGDTGSGLKAYFLCITRSVPSRPAKPCAAADESFQTMCWLTGLLFSVHGLP